MKVLTPWADGLEEMEAVIIVDMLRRAGWSVTAAGIGGDRVRASRGVVLVPDAAWREIDPSAFDLLVLPGGGPGAEALAAHEGVRDAIRAMAEAGKTVAAVCAAPLVLAAAGVLRGRTATCYPALADKLTAAGARYVDAPVVSDGVFLTSQGPGTCFAFTLALIARHAGEPAARRLAAAGLITSSWTPA